MKGNRGNSTRPKKVANRCTPNKTFKGRKNNVERNNFQDEAEIREYDKGYAAGKSSKFPQPRVGSNDPSWYYKDANILNDVASFSFNKPLGTYMDTFETLSDIPGNRYVLDEFGIIPGVLSMKIAPSPGISLDAQSPMNLAATNAYSYVRYKNSGSVNYDSPDLMLYLLAMDSIYSCWNWLKRIYGLASTYSQTNRYLPKALLVANRVDMDDLLNHLADFRAYLNVKANEISAFCVPATMSYNIRHSWLFSNVYTDSNTRKAQTYIYVPAWFYKYDEMTSSKGGQLVPLNVTQDWTYSSTEPNLFKVSELKNILNTMLEAVNYSEDIGIMSGDILKAYGDSGLFKVSTFEPDYRVEPVYNREVLTQIENANPIALVAGDYVNFKITQNPDTNWIEYNPKFGMTGPGTYNRGWVNFHWDNPTPADVMVATRLKVTYTFETDPSADAYITSCGSEILTNWEIYGYTYGSDGRAFVKSPIGTQPYLQVYQMSAVLNSDAALTPDQQAQCARALAAYAALIAFDWAPQHLFTYYHVGNQHSLVCGSTWDWDNYTQLSQSNIEAMNLVALLSEFNVPN